MIVICILVSKLLEGRDNLMHIVFSTQGPYFFFLKEDSLKSYLRLILWSFSRICCLISCGILYITIILSL